MVFLCCWCGFCLLPELLITELLTGRSVLVRSAFKLSYLSHTLLVSFIVRYVFFFLLGVGGGDPHF